MKTQLVELPVPTPAGEFIARYSERGLAELNFPAGRTFTRVVKQNGVPAKIRQWHRVTEAALKKILAGKEPEEFPPLDWNGATEFQKSVWRQMRKISLGKTKSYGEIAEQVGKPKAVRAVGGACGANPIPVLVPCHRVLAANKKLGGFSGGLDWKRKLLAREGIKLPSAG
ncbi:MAG TPA: methylated-DNA--[protein]-cysteine S-methyltransferase [Candidatus Aquilonibacter sp.]|nr:methylated-DNA--[protein]-cysteine S-methyltransferase [Candidatus Aquilonibacter sp.]